MIIIGSVLTAKVAMTVLPAMMTFHALGSAMEYLEKGKEEADKTSYTIKEFVGGAR